MTQTYLSSSADGLPDLWKPTEAICDSLASLCHHYGSCIAHYDWIEQEQMDAVAFVRMLGRVGYQRWWQIRAQWRQEQSDQLKMYRFRHKRERFLQELETRWATVITCT